MLKKILFLTMTIFTITGLHISSYTMTNLETVKQTSISDTNSPILANSMPSSGGLGNWNPFSGIKNAINTTTKWAKRGLYAALGFLGYNTIVKPAAEKVYGKDSKPLKVIDFGIKTSLVVGGIVGALYLYNKLSQKGLIQSIKDAKDQIVQKITDTQRTIMHHVSARINIVIKSFNDRFNKTDSTIDRLETKLSKMKNKLSTIQTITTETNDIVKNKL